MTKYIFIPTILWPLFWSTASCVKRSEQIVKLLLVGFNSDYFVSNTAANPQNTFPFHIFVMSMTKLKIDQADGWCSFSDRLQFSWIKFTANGYAWDWENFVLKEWCWVCWHIYQLWPKSQVRSNRRSQSGSWDLMSQPFALAHNWTVQWSIQLQNKEMKGLLLCETPTLSNKFLKVIFMEIYLC